MLVEKITELWRHPFCSPVPFCLYLCFSKQDCLDQFRRSDYFVSDLRSDWNCRILIEDSFDQAISSTTVHYLPHRLWLTEVNGPYFQVLLGWLQLSFRILLPVLLYRSKHSADERKSSSDGRVFSGVAYSILDFVEFELVKTTRTLSILTRECIDTLDWSS